MTRLLRVLLLAFTIAHISSSCSSVGDQVCATDCTGYQTCTHSGWQAMPCPLTTVCHQTTSTTISCDFPPSNIAPCSQPTDTTQAVTETTSAGSSGPPTSPVSSSGLLTTSVRSSGPPTTSVISLTTSAITLTAQMSTTEVYEVVQVPWPISPNSRYFKRVESCTGFIISHNSNISERIQCAAVCIQHVQCHCMSYDKATGRCIIVEI